MAQILALFRNLILIFSFLLLIITSQTMILYESNNSDPITLHSPINPETRSKFSPSGLNPNPDTYFNYQTLLNESAGIYTGNSEVYGGMDNLSNIYIM